jgi:hypothetical protein
MTRAWQLARAWHADARSLHFNQQQGRARVALRLDAPAPFVGKIREHFAEALLSTPMLFRGSARSPATSDAPYQPRVFPALPRSFS